MPETEQNCIPHGVQELRAKIFLSSVVCSFCKYLSLLCKGALKRNTILTFYFYAVVTLQLFPVVMLTALF